MSLSHCGSLYTQSLSDQSVAMVTSPNQVNKSLGFVKTATHTLSLLLYLYGQSVSRFQRVTVHTEFNNVHMTLCSGTALMTVQ